MCYNGNIKRKSEEVCLCISTLAIQSIVPPVPAGQASGRFAIILAQDLRSAVQCQPENALTRSRVHGSKQGRQMGAARLTKSGEH